MSAMRTTASIGDLRARVITSNAETWPMDTCGSSSWARLEAMTMSASATKWSPPPAHTPLTAAITGFQTSLCHAVNLSSARLVRRDCSRSASLSRDSCTTSSPV
jgi:hypothetical protein